MTLNCLTCTEPRHEVARQEVLWYCLKGCLRAFLLSPFGIWRVADTVRLETAVPPVFGKEDTNEGT